MKYYFYLQYKRIYRIVDKTGFNPIIGGVIILFIFVLLSNSIFERLEHPEIIYPILSLFLFGKLSGKARNQFLKNTFNRIKYRQVRLLENLLLASSFVIFLFFKNEYISGFIFLLTALAISQFNKIGSINFVIPTPFYKKPFEFIVGFRKTFFIYLLLYFVSYMAISVQNFNLGLFTLIAVLLIPFSFYTKPEHPFYVWIHSQSPSEFIYGKIITAILFSSALALPIVIPMMIYFPLDNFETILLVSIVAYFVLVAGVLGKYSFFPHETPIPVIFTAISILFPPLLIFVIPYFYSKSNKSLKKLLK